jgi:hypothetical protein
MNISPIQKLKMIVLGLTAIAVFTPILTVAAPSTLVIDEFRIYGENSNDEYLVIANYGSMAVNLNGYRLVKRAKSTSDYKLIDNFGDYTMYPNQRIVVAHQKYTGARDFTFFLGTTSTIADNNSIFLLAPDKSIVDLVGYGDAVYYEGAPAPAPEAGEVYARVNGKDTDNNSTDFVLRKTAEVIDLNADKLLISELLPNPDVGEEWFELYNPTNLPISLENLKICDVLGSKHCYFFEDSDDIAAGSYKIYKQSATKITLNNTGDSLELYDVSDNLLTDTGGDYGEADKGVSFSLFGSEYMWTKAVTPSEQNIFVDIIETEPEDTDSVVKTVKSRKVATSSKITTPKVKEIGSEESGEAVKAAETKKVAAATQTVFIDKKTIGWALIGLAILLVVGYTLWYFRDYAKDIYNKIRHRDDSARF